MVEKTKHHICRFLDKVAEKFPAKEEPEIFTDIHVRVNQESGDLMAFDDEDREITRCVVEDWINNSDSTEVFYNMVVMCIRSAIEERKPELGIIQPYNFVLENENGEHIEELFVVDDSETTILGAPFMQDLEKDLDDFIERLMKE